MKGNSAERTVTAYRNGTESRIDTQGTSIERKSLMQDMQCTVDPDSLDEDSEQAHHAKCRLYKAVCLSQSDCCGRIRASC